MAPPLSQSEIQQITRLLEQGKALPDKYRDVLFVERSQAAESTPSAENPEQTARADAPSSAPPQMDSNAAFSLAEFGEFLLNASQIQQALAKYVSRVESGTRSRFISNEPDDLAAKCADEMIQIVPEVLQQAGNAEHLRKWQDGTNLSKDTRRQLFRIVRETLLQRQIEMKKEREAKKVAEKDAEREAEIQLAQGLLAKYPDVVESFLVIAERKVSVRDEYGDERLTLLPNLINECIAKIAGRQGYSETYVKTSLRKGDIRQFTSYKAIRHIRTMLRTKFLDYHRGQMGKKRSIEELSALTGVEFETAVGRLLSEAGWQVTATAATGDQGADLIASKENRKVVIQAKRHNSPVGNKAVQEVVGAIPFYGGTEGCVVTNSTFTPAARALAQKNNIRLIDGLQFEKIADL